MVQSAVINEAIVFITALSMRAVIRRTEEGKLPETFRYFTVLSNLFCAFTALILLVCEFCGVLPAWAATLKYMGTVAVTLTFLVVLLFLWACCRSSSTAGCTSTGWWSPRPGGICTASTRTADGS